MIFTVKFTVQWADDAHCIPRRGEESMGRQLTNVYSGGNPNLAAIRQQVPHHSSGRLGYQSALGDWFVFYFKRNWRKYDIFIERQRDYGDRDTSSQATHRLGLDYNRPRICIQAGKEPRDLPNAILLSMLWAERTSHYIRHGLPWS
jgi:hypothetical protein